MTNFIAGAGRFIICRGAAAVVVVGLSLGLAGCESSSAIFGGSTGTLASNQLAQPQAAAKPVKRIAVAPVIGAPDIVAKRLAQDFSAAIALKNVRLATPPEPSDFTLRGYVVAAKEAGRAPSGVKISYIWDVTDPAGRRVDRITGEEVVPGASSADAWAAVTPQVSQAIAQKSSQSLADWLAAQSAPPAAVASATPTGIGATATAPIVAPTAVGALPASPVDTARATPTVTPLPLVAVVPSLTGAPGDGNNVLAHALQAELAKNGVSTSGAATSAYRVEGIVKLGTIADGKQSVQIDWNVKDPQGKRVGTVTQKNEIAAGSLDNAWGRTADAAAAAAAQGILKLLPRATASN